MTNYTETVVKTESIEIEKIVLDVHSLFVASKLNYDFCNSRNDRDKRDKESVIYAKHRLAGNIKRLITTEKIIGELGEPYIKAFIHLPYVKDQVVKNLEAEVSRKIDEAYEVFERWEECHGRISAYNLLPWYKKLFKWSV